MNPINSRLNRQQTRSIENKRLAIQANQEETRGFFQLAPGARCCLLLAAFFFLVSAWPKAKEGREQTCPHSAAFFVGVGWLILETRASTFGSTSPSHPLTTFVDICTSATLSISTWLARLILFDLYTRFGRQQPVSSTTSIILDVGTLTRRILELIPSLVHSYTPLQHLLRCPPCRSPDHHLRLFTSTSQPRRDRV